MSTSMSYSSGGRRGAPKNLSIAQPFSLQAEEALLGALITDPHGVFDIVGEHLAPDHFYDPFCKAVYEKSIGLMNDGDTVDLIVLVSLLDGVLGIDAAAIEEKLARLVETYPTAINAKQWADVILSKSVDRRMAEAGDRLIQIAHAQELTPEEKLAEGSRLLAEAGEGFDSEESVSMAQMMAETVGEVEKFAVSGGGITGLPTGYDELDEFTSGLHEGELIVIAARPGMGKTSLILGMIDSWVAKSSVADRVRVQMFSFEMPRKQIGMRFLALNADIPLQHLRRGQLDPKEYAAMTRYLEESAGYTFIIEDTAGLNITQVCARARKAHRKSKLGAIVIDYLQLINESGNSNDNKATRVGEISRGLKQLSRELQIPVVALSQLNRSVEQRQDKRPMMSDLRESGAIEQDADVIMFIYRDDFYNKNSPDIGKAEIIIAKQRNGPVGTAFLGFDKPRAAFHNLNAKLSNDNPLLPRSPKTAQGQTAHAPSGEAVEH